MPKLQRYISKELAHFVGRNEPDDEARYKLLVAILKSGILKNPSHEGGLKVRAAKISENEMFNPQMVCFCDIPIDDLGIHLEKYGRFGLSFLKSFLVQRGANPVFYVAKNSMVHTWLSVGTGGSEVHISRGEYFDRMTLTYFKLYQATQLERAARLAQAAKLGADAAAKEFFFGTNGPVGVTERELLWRDVDRLLEFQVFSFVKCFDEQKEDDDDHNYYMEREWRVLGHVEFQISDVYRTILPQSFAKRFREDVPSYMGQLNFAD